MIVLSALKENNSFERYNFRIKGGMWKWSIYIRNVHIMTIYIGLQVSANMNQKSLTHNNNITLNTYIRSIGIGQHEPKIFNTQQ